MAIRHECSVSANYPRTKGVGRPKRKRCAHCGSTRFHVEDGLYGVFEWTGTNRYPLADAKDTFEREDSAQTYADTENATHGTNYVVRWTFQRSN